MRVVYAADNAAPGSEVGIAPGGSAPAYETSVLLPAAADAIEADAFLEHAHSQALLESASLTRLSTSLVDLAVVGRRTSILDVA